VTLVLVAGLLGAPSASADAPQCTGGATYQQVAAGSFEFTGCVTTVARSAGGPLYLISGTTSLSGVTLAATGQTTTFTPSSFNNCTADPCASAIGRFWSAAEGAELAVDPSSLQLESNVPYSVTLTIGTSQVSLYSGRIHIPPPLSSESALIDLDVTRGAALIGLPLQGRFQLYAQQGGVRIHVNVGLPSLLGGVAGETDVSVLDDGTVTLNQLRVAVGNAEIKGMRISGLEFVYDASMGLWEGSASLTLPTPAAYHLSITLRLLNNAFSSISGSISNLNVSLGYGVFLQHIGATFQLKPSVVIGGSIGLSAGPNVLSRTAMSIDGALRVLFPGRQLEKGVYVNIPYTRVEATGALKIVGSTLASGYLGVQTNGYVEGGGTLGQSASFGSVEGTVRGEANTTTFNLEGAAAVRVKFGYTFNATGHAVVSSKGLAGCAEFGWLSGGVGYKWGSGFALFRGCDLGPYRAIVVHASLRRVGARVAQAAQSLTVPAALPEEGIEVLGTTAPPQFTLTAPDGTTQVTTPSDDTQGDMTPTFAIVRQTENHSTAVVLHAPQAGTWTLTPAPGSSPIASVLQASGLPPAEASVTVTGNGRTRKLTWHLQSEPGQVVQFVERGPEDDVVLATTDKPTGSVRFRVPDGIAGARLIEAQFQEAGLPRADETVGTYTAPGPAKPKRPINFGVRREGTQVMVQWNQPGTAPDHYELLWSAADGEDQDLELPGSARNATFTTDLATDTVTVKLQPVARDGVRGPSARFSG
jgi:hypothetical protein